MYAVTLASGKLLAVSGDVTVILCNYNYIDEYTSQENNFFKNQSKPRPYRSEYPEKRVNLAISLATEGLSPKPAKF